MVKGISLAPAAQNGVAARQDSRDGLHRKRDGAFRPDQSVKTVQTADGAPSVSQNGIADGSTNDGVQARAVSAAVGYSDSLYGQGHRSSVVREATGLST